MKFTKAIDTNLKNFGLRRIKIKFDPRNKAHETYKAYNSYEGYVLEENEKTVSVFVINAPEEMDAFVDVPRDMIHISEKSAKLKEYIISRITEDVANMEGNIVEMINSSADIISMETILKNNGLSDTNLKDLYRDFILQ